MQQHNIFGNVCFYNWWDSNYEANWFYQFLVSHNLLPLQNGLGFCSVFGDPQILEYIKTPRLFICGENIRNFPDYSHYLLYSPIPTLSVGYDEFENENYVRMPMGILSYISPLCKPSDIREEIQRLTFPQINTDRRFACIISRHDNNGLKAQIYNGLSNLLDELIC